MRLPALVVTCLSIALSLSIGGATAAECDGAEGLRTALLEHDKVRIEFQYKMQTGYIRKAGKGDITIARKRNEFLYQGATPTLRAIQSHLKAMDASAATYALVYDSAESSECVWLIGPDTLLEARRKAGRKGQDISVASSFRRHLDVDVRARGRIPERRDATGSATASPSGQGVPAIDAQQLRQAVIPDPLLRQIQKSARTLLILPVGDLSAVPFAALPGIDSGTFLVDSTAAMVLPSVDGLFFWVPLSPFREFGNALIVGDPDLTGDPIFKFIPLPGAQTEAKSVARIVKASALIGQSATHDQVMTGLERGPKLIYLATHGIADARNPMDASFLALGGKHLLASEIKTLTFHSKHPLVVMSACQTGLGKTFGGGIFGLARAWIHAGAAQVLASQWNVDDAATADLMTFFMEGMQRGDGSSSAFRKAMLQTRAKHPDPAMWASFNLFGYAQPGS